MISVNMGKFFDVFAQLVKRMDKRLFNCKLQEINFQQENNMNFFLRCDYDSSGKFAVVSNIKRLELISRVFRGVDI